MRFVLVIFTRESSYCFQRVLAVAILSICLSVRLSVRLSVTRVDQSKTVQDIFTGGCLEDSSLRKRKAFP